MSEPTAPIVPHRLDDAVTRTPLIDVATDRALIRYPGVGRLMIDVTGSEQRQLEPGRAASDLDFLADTTAALAALLNGQISLRASVVEVDGAGIALCGLGPSGKSTAAAALALRGHRLVTDAVAIVDVSGDPMVAPRPDGVKLWPQAVQQLGLDLDTGDTVRDGLALRRFHFDTASEPVPLVAALLMQDNAEGGYDTERQRGFDAVDRVKRVRWHGSMMQSLGLEAQAFWWTTRVAGIELVAELKAPRRRPDPGRLADLILETVAAL